MKKEFPVVLQKNGAVVKVYKSGKGTYFTICWKGSKGRQREVRNLESAALLRANEVLNDLVAGRADRIKVSAEQLAYYRACESKLGEVPLMTAVDFYLSKHAIRSGIISGMVDWFIEGKRLQQLSIRHIDTLRYHLKKFAAHFPAASMHRLTTSELDTYLSSTWKDARTRRNARISLITFFKWCQSRGYIDAGKTAAEKTAIPKVVAKDPGILTPEALKSLFEYADRRIWPMLILGAFAGMRVSEILRVTWGDIDWGNNQIVLSSAMTKTNRRRVVHLSSKVILWLQFCTNPAFEHTDPIVDVARPHDLLAAGCKAAGIKWAHNALRHSYISYWMALNRNAAVVAEQCGTSEAMIQTNYKMTTTQEQANKWFSIDFNDCY